MREATGTGTALTLKVWNLKLWNISTSRAGSLGSWQRPGGGAAEPRAVRGSLIGWARKGPGTQPGRGEQEPSSAL